MLHVFLTAVLSAVSLPLGPSPEPVPVPHFPDRVHAFVWRNWQLVPADIMARVLGTTPDEVIELGHAMGLEGPPMITPEQRQRSYITVIRRNWHLLPYEQLLQLLEWKEAELAFTLREDDFLWIKLGSSKPKCEPLKWETPDEAAKKRQVEIADTLKRVFPEGVGQLEEPLFSFVRELSTAPTGPDAAEVPPSRFSPRYCYSYFALYGDPLLDGAPDAYPDAYLERLAQSGANGVWLQAVLYKLAPFPWDESLSDRYEERLKNLAALVDRAKSHGIGVYLYLNEPRAMPLPFFDDRPELKGVVEGDHAALCTSHPLVQSYISGAIATVCAAVPNLAGFFTITASENLTNCWSHGQGAACPRCSDRGPAEVIAEVNAIVQAGIEVGGGGQTLIAWDWGWGDDWAADAIRRLPAKTMLQSVSEWSIPIKRGGVESVVGEYSISEVGPGPRATKHWQLAKQRKAPLRTLAKIQANVTWELSAVPYIPAVENVARHAANLRAASVDGLMLGWTLGGYPSPNLEVVAAIGASETITPDEAMEAVARKRFGDANAAAIVKAWKAFSTAFSEYPYHIGTVYQGPQQMGPANLLYAESTGYRSTMVGFPYDDVDGWRSVYPTEVFAAQFRTMADQFDAALKELAKERAPSAPAFEEALDAEMRVAQVAAIHFRSVANQVQYVTAQRAHAAAASDDDKEKARASMLAALDSETGLAARLLRIQSSDSRFGFEASNHYFYIPIDLAEKVVNCAYLKSKWLR